jgi:hypothetical protein
VARDKNGNPLTGAELMVQVAAKHMKDGNPKYWELIRDTAGFKPVDKVMMAEVDQSVVDEVEAMVLGDQTNGQSGKKENSGKENNSEESAGKDDISEDEAADLDEQIQWSSHRAGYHVRGGDRSRSPRLNRSRRGRNLILYEDRRHEEDTMLLLSGNIYQEGWHCGNQAVGG